MHPLGIQHDYLRHGERPGKQSAKIDNQGHAAVQLRDDDIDRSLPYRLRLGSPCGDDNEVYRPSGTRQPRTVLGWRR